MNKFKLDNKGLTLVEVIVTIAIIAIILPVVYSIFSIGNTTFTSTRDRGFAQQEARIVAEHLNNELRYAREISFDGTAGTHSISIVNNEGVSSLIKGEEILVRGNWDIEGLSLEAGIIKGNIVINDGSKYKLAINIPLENIDKDAIEGIVKLEAVIYYTPPD